MIKIEKNNDENNPDIIISDGLNSFIIARNNLPDLCWHPELNYYTNNEDVIFKIKEEDGEIHILFDQLYQDIIDGNIFPLKDSDLIGKSSDEIKKNIEENEEQKSIFKELAKSSGLIKNGVITWHSEDYDEYEFSSVLTIKKLDDTINIIFSKNKISNNENSMLFHPTYNIRITESGGRYWPFFILFANFRRKLQNIDWEKINIENSQEKILKYK